MEKLQKYLPTLAIVLVVIIAALMWRESVNRAADLAALRTSLQGMEQRIAERGKETREANAKVDQQVADARTPDEMARLIALLAGMKQTPTIVPVYAPTSSNPPTNEGVKPVVGPPSAPLPDAPSAVKPGDLVTPAPEVPTLLGKLADGAKCANSLQTCEKDKADLKAGLEKAKTTAAGGSRKSKVARVLFHSLCAGGGGAAGATVSGGKGAAIGATAGVIGCAIFGK